MIDRPTAASPLCAITGASGYVGGQIAAELVRSGWRVLELGRTPKAGGARFQLGAPVDPELFSGVSALVHCAYDFAPYRRVDIRCINVDGTRRLLQAARDGGVRKIVCLSSISAFEGCVSLYGQAKLEIESLALAAGGSVIRPGLVYGKSAGAMFGRLVASIRGSPIVPVPGDGSQVQFLVHGMDLADAVRQYCTGTRTLPPMITLAHDKPWSMRDLLEEIARAQGRRPLLVPVPWRLPWAALKVAESLGVPLKFRSDSLVSLMHQNPAPDFGSGKNAGLVCRPFTAEQVHG